MANHQDAGVVDRSLPPGRSSMPPLTWVILVFNVVMLAGSSA
jgi:hypothetical protein